MHTDKDLFICYFKGKFKRDTTIKSPVDLIYNIDIFKSKIWSDSL